jgi:hypothetical protein
MKEAGGMSIKHSVVAGEGPGARKPALRVFYSVLLFQGTRFKIEAGSLRRITVKAIVNFLVLIIRYEQ